MSEERAPVCEYCGCQAIAAIDELTREHERALDHVRAAEHAARTGDVTAARDASALLQQLLAPHTAVEERGLFLAVAREFPEQVRALVDDHRCIDGVLDELQRAQPPAAWATRLLAAMAALREHILKEQDGVFPAALALLQPADWEAIDDVRARVGSIAH